MIESEKYLTIFHQAANRLDKKRSKEMQLEVAVGEILDCVFLKIYKKSWAGPGEDALTARSRIFFSIWISDKSDSEQKILYNIHAFKLRLLPGYSIESRKFAERFRVAFKTQQSPWPHVSTQFGPLTLMQGWSAIDTSDFENTLVTLANNFLNLAPLIDQTLDQFKEPRLKRFRGD